MSRLKIEFLSRRVLNVNFKITKLSRLCVPVRMMLEVFTDSPMTSLFAHSVWQSENLSFDPHKLLFELAFEF